MGDDQIERIEGMEARMDRAREIIDALSKSLQDFYAFSSEFETLRSYYGSKQWFADMADADSGAIPSCVKMGVLTEDLPYDVVTEWLELSERINSVDTE